MRARDNPYRVERLEQLTYRFSTGGWEEILATLRRHRYRGAVVGPHGSGKTTLIEELRDRLIAQGIPVALLNLNEQTRGRNQQLADDWLRETPADTILILDGAEQLNAWRWRRFERRTRAHRGLIITTHAPGRMPTLYGCESSPQIFESLLSELSQDAQPNPQTVATLFQEHHGNIRECLRALYDECARER